MVTKVKRLLTVLVGAVLTVVSVISCTYMLRGYPRLFGFYDLEKDSVDVFFVGTSVTFTTFMPMEAWNDYGIVAYNYCTNVMFENSIRYSIREIERRQNPRLIMVDIAPFYFEHYAGKEEWPEEDREKYIKYNLDSRKYNPDRFALVYEINRDRKGSFADYWYYFFDISRYHTNVFTLSHYDNAEKHIPRGYMFFEHNGASVFNAKNAAVDDGSVVPITEPEQRYLDQLLETAENADAEVVFYAPPIFFRKAVEVGRKNYVRNYIEERGFKFADFSGDTAKIGIDYKTDLWNASHFDSLGAEKVTRYLCEYIKSEFDIPDRRNDEKYAGLNDDYEEWKVLKKEYNEIDLGLRIADETEEMQEEDG